jgi:cleavage and polyadenylation specificity factor subunit 4
MRHIKKIICQNYLTGFCPDGPDCDLAHPRFEMLPDKLRIRPDRPLESKTKEKSVLEIQIEQEREKLRLQDEAEKNNK